MKIGIIGSGNVGGALGKGWAKMGHSVVFGVRDPGDEKVKSLLKQAAPNARAGSVQEAAAFGEVVVLATPWPATQDAIRSAGNLKGKVVFDCTNPLKPDLSGLAIAHTTSAGEQSRAMGFRGKSSEDIQHDGRQQHGKFALSRRRAGHVLLRRRCGHQRIGCTAGQ